MTISIQTSPTPPPVMQTPDVSTRYGGQPDVSTRYDGTHNSLSYYLPQQALNQGHLYSSYVSGSGPQSRFQDTGPQSRFQDIGPQSRFQGTGPQATFQGSSNLQYPTGDIYGGRSAYGSQNYGLQNNIQTYSAFNAHSSYSKI